MSRPTTTLPARHERSLAMTYEEWLAWAGESTQSEWVDGKAIIFMPPSGLHQDALWFLATLAGWYVRARDLGTLRIAPFEMRLSDGSAREPDILFVARAHDDRLTPQRLIGPADLVVELISDDSVSRDRVEKLAAYQAAGIPEYWLVDSRPRRRVADFLGLQRGGYQSIPLDELGRFHSRVLPGFWLRPDWLWQDPLPDPLACLAEIAPDAVARALRSNAGA